MSCVCVHRFLLNGFWIELLRFMICFEDYEELWNLGGELSA